MLGFNSRSLTHKIAFLIGALSSIIHIVFWYIATIGNPIDGPIPVETVIITFIFMVLPAIYVLISLWLNMAILTLAAFIWSLPMAYYFTYLAGGVFKWFGIVSILYLLTYILMILGFKDANA
ncbi:MAG: hypothetical protein K6T91_08990 [Firmicutes bacterium]|nr:hypothetical protein [Bacillota bacterium]